MRNTTYAACAALSLLAAACAGPAGQGEGGEGGGDSPTMECGWVPEVSQAEFSADCSGLEGDATFECLEQRFWGVLRVDFDARLTVFDMMTAHIEATEPVEGEHQWLSRLYFQRGQLAMAIALEDKPDNAIQFIGGVRPDFQRAAELDPGNTILPTWDDSMAVALANAARDPVALEAALESAWENVEDCPLGNIPSITGTTLGLPMSTGAPQKSIELLERWDCDAMGWCTANTWKAPYAAPGLNYHLAESYARVGDAETARVYLDKSAAAPGYDEWPYRYVAEEASGDLDAFVGKFTALGEDGDAFNIVYANSEYGCKFCHQVD
jgi:hypothetical protein